MSVISLENRLAIHELIAEYSHHVDNYRGENWASLFIDGGRLVGPGIEVIAPQGFIDKAQELKRGDKEYRHAISNIYLEADSNNERATANAYGVVSDWANKPAEMSIFVEYRFDVIKQGERWKIALMRVHMPYDL